MIRPDSTGNRCALSGLVLSAVLAGAQAFAQSPAVTSPASAAVPTANAADIRDIRGPEPIPSQWLWVIGLAGGALCAGGAYAAWRWYQSRRDARTKLPYEIALEQLDATRALMDVTTVREYSIAVSDIVRRYVEQRFQVMAAHRTTEEFLHDLLNASEAQLSSHRTSLSGFLSHCDLAKFGGWRLSMPSMESMHESARRFVLATGRPAQVQSNGADSPSTAGKDSYDSIPTT